MQKALCMALHFSSALLHGRCTFHRPFGFTGGRVIYTNIESAGGSSNIDGTSEV